MNVKPVRICAVATKNKNKKRKVFLTTFCFVLIFMYMFDESHITKAYPYDNKYVKKCYYI